MKILGIGVDIVENKRLKKSIKNKSFLLRLFTFLEIKNSKLIKDKSVYFSKKFAAKESFSKALGVQGGILAGTEMTRTHALNHSRSWLLSGSQPPGVAAAQKAAIEVLMSEPEHHARLWENTNYFRKELQSMGFDTGESVTPIIPVMCGESSTAKAMTHALGE